MTTSIQSSDVALRLALTVLAGLLIGYDRGEHGKAAGLRTTVLVCLAASVAMIQVNLLLPTAGRSSDSFVMNDLMRLPLGILTGVGFIGAGAIIRRDDLVVGVTTAATLWLVTVIGLCLGGGQIGLGLATTAIGLVVLWGLKLIECRFKRERRSKLLIRKGADGPGEIDIRQRIEQCQAQIMTSRIQLSAADHAAEEWEFQISELRYPADTGMSGCIREIAALPGIERIEWQMQQ